MSTQAITNERNVNTLSGIFRLFSFNYWWIEKSEDEKVKETTNSFIDIESLFSFLQIKNCIIVNKEEVIDFLNNHISIINYLYEAPDVIREKFGEVKLNLELCFDPEFDDNEGELFLNIEIDMDVKIAHNKLGEIDKEWLLSRVGKNIGKFNLNLEFI